MKHKDKIKLARKLRTIAEKLARVPIFQTKNWASRQKAIRERVKNTEIRVKKASLEAKKRRAKDL